VRKKFRKKDKEIVSKVLSSKLPLGAKMAVIQPTEKWAEYVQVTFQAVTGKTIDELKQELGNPCPKETGEVEKCEDCEHYQRIVECSKRVYRDEKTGELKECSAPCDYMFDSGDLCVNCPSAQYLFLGIDCPCPRPGIYRYGEPDDIDDLEDEWEEDTDF
jgi:hypothetical protein